MSTDNSGNQNSLNLPAPGANAADEGRIPSQPPASNPGSNTQDASGNTSTAQPQDNLHSGVPATAEDSDLIEQEWVHKAKAIVEHTREDPFSQNKQINKVKAEYIRKRYNRDIKVDES